MFFDNVSKLCSQNGISVTHLALILGISKSNVTNWKNGSVPKSDKISKIATYFNVSTDYLLRNEQKNKPDTKSDGLGPKGKAILERLNKIEALSKEDYDFAIAQLDLIINRREIQDKK